MQKVAHKFEGRTFGRLSVVKRLENYTSPRGVKFSKWLCRCECGNEKSVIGIDLKSGKTRSCGCLFRETTQKKGLANKTHGGYSENSEIDFLIRYRTLQAIKYRVAKRGYKTDLEISDIPEVGDVCPVLGIRYVKFGKKRDLGPSIDRVNSNLPYLKKFKDNLCFISFKANRLKNNSSIEDLMKIIGYMKSRGAQLSEKSSLLNSKPSQAAGNEDQADASSQVERLNEKTPETVMQ
jgi:hypothetical protein